MLRTLITLINLLTPVYLFAQTDSSTLVIAKDTSLNVIYPEVVDVLDDKSDVSDIMNEHISGEHIVKGLYIFVEEVEDWL